MNEHSCSRELASTGFTCKNQSGWERQHSRSGVNVQRQRWANWHVSFPCCITVSYLLVGLISGSSVDWDPFFCWVLPWGSWWGERGMISHTNTCSKPPPCLSHTKKRNGYPCAKSGPAEKMLCSSCPHCLYFQRDGGYVFRYCATLQFSLKKQ